MRIYAEDRKQFHWAMIQVEKCTTLKWRDGRSKPTEWDEIEDYEFPIIIYLKNSGVVSYDSNKSISDECYSVRELKELYAYEMADLMAQEVDSEYWSEEVTRYKGGRQESKPAVKAVKSSNLFIYITDKEQLDWTLKVVERFTTMRWRKGEKPTEWNLIEDSEYPVRLRMGDDGIITYSNKNTSVFDFEAIELQWERPWDLAETISKYVAQEYWSEELNSYIGSSPKPKGINYKTALAGIGVVGLGLLLNYKLKGDK